MAGRPKTRVVDYLAEIIVAVIIALLAAVVIPTYQERKVRASVIEVFAFAKNIQARIEDYVKVRGKLPDQPDAVNPATGNMPLHLGEIRIETGGTIRLVPGPMVFAR